MLLLDEPTNDLDDAGIAWLEDRLAAHRGARAVVTHDRALLDRIAADIVHVEGGSLRRYGDGYAGYLTARESERRRLLAEYEAWRQDLACQQALVTANAFRLNAIPRKLERASFGHGAFRARGRDHGAMGRIRMAKERVARLHADPAPRPVDPLRFTLWQRPGIRVAWLRQDITTGSGATLLDAFAVITGAYRDDAADELLRLGLFRPDDLHRQVAQLSVGQRRRLEVALAVTCPSDVLLLDEPTNHLAPELLEQMEDALRDYTGAVLTVAHDRRWRERAEASATTRQIHVAPGGLVGLPDSAGKQAPPDGSTGTQ